MAMRTKTKVMIGIGAGLGLLLIMRARSASATPPPAITAPPVIPGVEQRAATATTLTTFHGLGSLG